MRLPRMAHERLERVERREIEMATPARAGAGKSQGNRWKSRLSWRKRGRSVRGHRSHGRRCSAGGRCGVSRRRAGRRTRTAAPRAGNSPTRWERRSHIQHATGGKGKWSCVTPQPRRDSTGILAQSSSERLRSAAMQRTTAPRPNPNCPFPPGSCPGGFASIHIKPAALPVKSVFLPAGSPSKSAAGHRGKKSPSTMD